MLCDILRRSDVEPALQPTGTPTIPLLVEEHLLA